MSVLPFKQGDRVEFNTGMFSGKGQVVGMSPCAGFRNLGVLVQHEELKSLYPSPPPMLFKYSVVLVPLYDHNTGFVPVNDVPVPQVRLLL
jgi:hypothetical protein